MPKTQPRPRDLHLVSIAEAARYTATATKTIRRRLADGSLDAYRFGPRLIRVDLNQVDQVMRPESRAAAAPPECGPQPQISQQSILDGAVFISIEQAAERLGLSHWTVRKLIADGKLPVCRRQDGRRIRLRLADVDALIVPTGGDHSAA